MYYPLNKVLSLVVGNTTIRKLQNCFAYCFAMKTMKQFVFHSYESIIIMRERSLLPNYEVVINA